MSKIWKESLCASIDAKGVSGGISICWNPLIISLTNLSSFPYSISSLFHLVGTNIKGHLLNIDGTQQARIKL